MSDYSDLKKRMEGAVTSFSKDLSGLRTGRASVSLVDGVVVDAYGTPTPLNQVCSVNVPEPRLISLQVWDKTLIPYIEKAIINADLGLNPSSDGQVIRLPIPDLTEERRKEMVKIASKYAEDKKIAIRNVRRDGMESLKKQEKDSEISEDTLHTESDNVQKLTDEFIGKIDDLFHAKEKEILTV